MNIAMCRTIPVGVSVHSIVHVCQKIAGGGSGGVSKNVKCNYLIYKFDWVTFEICPIYFCAGGVPDTRRRRRRCTFFKLTSYALRVDCTPDGKIERRIFNLKFRKICCR